MKQRQDIDKEVWRKYVENMAKRFQRLRFQSSSNHFTKSCWFSPIVFNMLIHSSDEFRPINPDMPHIHGNFIFYNLLGSSTIELSYVFTAQTIVRDRLFPYKFTCIRINSKKYFLDGSAKYSYFFPMNFEK